jgi:hypothetical protein
VDAVYANAWTSAIVLVEANTPQRVMPEPNADGLYENAWFGVRVWWGEHRA